MRRVCSILVEDGYDATYSTALNFLLLGGIFEALKEGGWSPETGSLLLDSFMKDSRIIEELNLEDMLLRIGEKISKKWGLCLS